MVRTISGKDRERIINSHIEGKRNVDIAQVLNIPKSTVSVIIKKYKDTGNSLSLARGGDKRSKLTVEEKESMCRWVDENPCITLKSLCRKVLENFQKEISTSSVDRHLKQFHFSLKRIDVIPERRNSPPVIEQRKIYASNFFQIWTTTNGENIYFLDETGFSVATRNKRGRARRGETPRLIVPATRTRNISVCASMTRGGMVNFNVRTSSNTASSFKNYLDECFRSFAREGVPNALLIMDNASIHKTTEVRNFVIESGHRIMFLPPYSPFLNPIENLFSKWKNYVVRAQPQNEQALNNLIDQGFRQITSEDCEGYCRNMVMHLLPCVNGEEIYD